MNAKSRKLPEIDPAGLSTYPLADRESKVRVDDLARPWTPGDGFEAWLDKLPRVLAAADLRALADAIVRAHEGGRRVVVGMGAHVIKVGLTPILIDLIRRGIVTGLLVNGACLVHDYELALAGKTSEDVEAALGEGAFGMARETGEGLNRIINDGVAAGRGLAESVGRAIAESTFPHKSLSVLAAAAEAQIPASCAVAIGADIIHMHADADGARIGAGAMRDFRLFCRVVADLSGGVYLNVGSAVILPEVFLKAVSVARNLGHPVDDLTTAVLDFLQHYRPRTNVVHRPTLGVGKGYYLIGHHEILVPLLAAAVLSGLPGRGE